MRTVKSLACGFVCLLAGCAIHPLPDDVTGRSTFHIVQKIRCEAREALTDISAVVLQNSEDPGTQRLGDLVAMRQVQVTDLFRAGNRYKVDRKVHAYFDTFALSALALGFTFDIEETNNAQADSNFQDPFTRGLFKLNARAGNKYQRKNKRDFIVGETFLELYEFLKEECEKYATGQKNYIYPITGEIGLREVFETFINLNKRSIDPAGPNPLPQAGKTVARFVDELKFTTTFSAGATPRIELTPLSKSFRLLNAQLAMDVSRVDIHQVEVALAAGPVVRSLEEAYRRVKIDGNRSKEDAVRQIILRRTENFFDDARELKRRFNQPVP